MTDISNSSSASKRLFDIVLATILAPFALAVSIVVAAILMVKGDPRPLFVQERIGRNGRSFKLVKFRTMLPQSPHVPSHEASAQLITPIGRHLRRTKLDELPQLWNVLRGEMSFVGPRPCLPTQTELLAERQEQGVLALTPGITGPGQIAGLDMSRPAELARMDATYLGHWSLRRDLAIIMATALGSGRGDAVR